MFNLSKRDTVLVTVVVAGFVVTGVLLLARGGAAARNPDFPDGHPFVCADCGCAMVLNDDELFDLKVKSRESDDPDAGRVVCTGCGSINTFPAMKCPYCGQYFVRPGGRPVCPLCKEPLPSPLDED